MLALLAAGGLALRPAPRLVLAGFALAGGLQLLILFGVVGRINLNEQARELGVIWTAWQREAEPRFAYLNNLNLPWLNPGSPPFVIPFNYGLDRAAGRQFEAGGIGGLITAGYFRTLLLPADTREEYDGGSLRRYKRGEIVNGLIIFRRQVIPTK